MKRRLALLAASLISFMAAAADAASLGDAELQRDTWRVVSLYTLALAPNCKPRRLSVTVTRPTTGAKFRKGVLVAGRWTERWVAGACKRKFSFTVDFRANPQGGTDISVHAPK